MPTLTVSSGISMDCLDVEYALHIGINQPSTVGAPARSGPVYCLPTPLSSSRSNHRHHLSPLDFALSLADCTGSHRTLLRDRRPQPARFTNLNSNLTSKQSPVAVSKFVYAPALHHWQLQAFVCSLLLYLVTVAIKLTTVPPDWEASDTCSTPSHLNVT